MTLATRLHILQPTNPQKVFDFARGLMADPDSMKIEWHDREQVTVEKTGYQYWREATYQTSCGQGLPAWLVVTYHPDGPLETRPTPEAYEDPDDLAYYTEKWEKMGADTFVIVDWDTAYGFHAENGAGCSDLHAFYLQEVGRWLDDRGVRYVWVNEFTGEVHKGGEERELGDPDRGRHEPKQDFEPTDDMEAQWGSLKSVDGV